MTGNGEPRMDTNTHELILKKEVFQVEEKVGDVVELLEYLSKGT